MKILVPREGPPSGDCGSYQCTHLELYSNGIPRTKKPRKEVSMRCNVYHCYRVTTRPPKQNGDEAQ